MRGSVEERFWAKVDKRGPDECWEWKAGRQTYGYGIFTISRGRQISAHRFSWQLAHKKNAHGLVIRHRCNNPPCVNPRHLVDGSYRDNSLDTIRSGHTMRGSKAKNSKLTNSDVRFIRTSYRRGATQQHLATMFKVSKMNISLIVRRKNWAWLK